MTDKQDRQRLDTVLVTRGLVGTRSRARDLIKRGCVRVGEAVAVKPGLQVAAGVDVTIDDDALPYVSRGGLKLAPALDTFGYDPFGRTCLDVGASTGGFTDILLQRGATRVYAVDVGRSQLALGLASDPRVMSLEGTDVRALDRYLVPAAITAIVADVSFISLTKALPPALALASPGAWLVALVKPQFEAGRDAVGKGGIVRDSAAREAAVEKVRSWLAGQPAWQVDGLIPSSVTGSGGNQEYLLGATYAVSSLST